MTSHSYYFHAPGHQSRWGVVDVGLKCTHSCRFCYYAHLDGDEDPFHGMRHADFRSKEHLLTLVDSLADNGFLGFDVTGGEPCLHPNIVEVIAHATKRGLSSRIITLGQFLTRKMKSAPDHARLIDGLLDAGLTNFLFSYHASEANLFHKITGESLPKLTDAMSILDDRRFQYTTNTTVFEDNYRHLPEIALSLLGRGTYLHNFIVMNAYYNWGQAGRAESVQAHYGAVAPYLKRAVSILEDACIAVNVRYAPHCTMAGFEKNIVGITGVRYDPYEWMNCIDHSEKGGDPVEMGRRIAFAQGEPSPGSALFGVEGDAKGTQVIAARGVSPNIAKLFPAGCRECSAIEACDGIDARYLGERGAAEFAPYVGQDRGSVLDHARKAYAAPFFVKRQPDADMASVMRRVMKPMPIGARPKVSAVVTCYNYGKYLARCLDSLKAQTYPVEVIVVDDGSTDDTYHVAAGYLPDIRFLRQPNSGQPAGPRNLGIAGSSGDLVFCLDADDWVEPSYVEECVRQFQRHPEASIVYPGTQCWNEDGVTKADMFCAGPYDFAKLLEGCLIVCASMFKREVWEATGGYKGNVRGCEDWQHWIEAGGLGYFGVPLPRQLFNYRRHANGIFETEVVPSHAEKHRQIILANSDLFPPEIVASARAAGERVPA